MAYTCNTINCIPYIVHVLLLPIVIATTDIYITLLNIYRIWIVIAHVGLLQTIKYYIL